MQMKDLYISNKGNRDEGLDYYLRMWSIKCVCEGEASGIVQ